MVAAAARPRRHRPQLPAHDHISELQRAGIGAAVTVQAQQKLEETRWLLDLARDAEAIAGVVGWAPIAAHDFVSSVEELAAHKKLVGLRHVVQTEAAGFLDDDAFNRGIRALRNTGLVYDLLIAQHQLEEAIRFVDRHPYQSFVLDHIAKPKIASGEFEPWRTKIVALSKRSNVSCKISGMVTEDSWSAWSIESLRPYLDVVVQAFGTERLMAGSDWPVCLLAAGYTQWWQCLRTYFRDFSAEERTQVFGSSAVRIYNLKLQSR